MKKRPLILSLLFVFTFFMSLNIIPRVYFIYKMNSFKDVNKMVAQKREKGQNDFLEKFATPTLAKSYCFYDLSEGPVVFNLNSGIYYWSFSLHENDLNELYHTYTNNDPDIEKKILIVTRKQAQSMTKNQHSKFDEVIISTTKTGVGMIRNFIKYWNKEDIHHSLLESQCSLLK